MAKHTLPTKEELETLYHEKGHDALVWYAWRNALRVLPLIGKVSFLEIWPEDTVHHIYSICRACVLLAQWDNASELVKSIFINMDFTLNKFHANASPVFPDSLVSSISSINAAATTEDYINNFFINDINIDNVLCSITVTNAFTDLAKVIINNNSLVSANAARSISTSYYAYASTSGRDYSSRVALASSVAARSDYEFILNKKNIDSSSWWISQPIWPMDFNENHNGEPYEFTQWKTQFYNELQLLKLGFLGKRSRRL